MPRRRPGRRSATRCRLARVGDRLLPGTGTGGAAGFELPDDESRETDAAFPLHGEPDRISASEAMVRVRRTLRPDRSRPLRLALDTPSALGDNLAEFLQNRESVSQALRDAAAAYRSAAREQGFLD